MTEAKLKCDPVKGDLPVLQYLTPGQLGIDPTYQRSIETGPSQRMIRMIAKGWNWDMCQPLVVAKRAEGYFVIDGQHRLAAAKLRGDLQVLPCHIANFASAEAEAAAFVEINKARRPLSAVDIFNAEVAAGDETAVAIATAIDNAGLALATHRNNHGMAPGLVANIGGIKQAWKSYGDEATTVALKVLARAFEGQTLQYAGTIFPGIPPIVGEDGEDFTYSLQLIEMLKAKPQKEWKRLIDLRKLDDPGMRLVKAAEDALSDAWDEALGAHLAGEAA